MQVGKTDTMDSTVSDASSPRHGMGKRRSIDSRAFIPERIGSEIGKRYAIENKEIGAGGYGKVFVARDKNYNDRMVAIKKVLLANQEKKKEFEKEVKIMKQLDHPNICKLLETYTDGRHMYFVMEYCSGREVFERIMDLGTIDERTTADVIKQTASALMYAHGHGIAHRDLKPENLCFCTDDPDDSQIKVIDWGLGFYFGIARMSSAVGSLTYAAPEVLDANKKNPYSPACDLWSLGVLSYVMICGKAPFWGSFTEQLRRMKREDYPMKDSTWRKTSDTAKDFIRGLLKCKPEKRTPIAEVLAHPWLRITQVHSDQQLMSEVLTNMRRFGEKSLFFSACVASVARQLDHRSLKDVHRVFVELDTNGDGVLELQEVKAGFERIFGADSDQVRDIESIFNKIDLDGSGQIDYTEFCAAGLSEHLTLQENVLWTAFRSFDVIDDDGRISKAEIQQVLQRTDVQKAWSEDVCATVAQDIMKEFDANGDGSIEFDEFVKVMRRQDRGADGAAAPPAPACIQTFDQTYNALASGTRDGTEAGTRYAERSDSRLQEARRRLEPTCGAYCSQGLGRSTCTLL
eukprot:TRINITY_DN148_c0_g1_i1.p2 TRINITY_DN148_c0_g1~~TRINITY_DN148_c0_g1_i1.p2  ORF type:complete len:574 (-),score=143.06 TRINITY_DN148_c0_g1_i1:68-1789(-)